MASDAVAKQNSDLSICLIRLGFEFDEASEPLVQCSAASSPFRFRWLEVAPPPRRPRATMRDMSSGKSQTVSHSKTIESAEGTPTADSNGS
jgi:hypothetical protein